VPHRADRGSSRRGQSISRLASQEARSYALVTLFVAVGLWFFARALNGERRALAGWALASSLALATHYFAGFVVFAEAVILLARVPERRRAVVAALIPSAVFVAQLPLLVEQRGNGQSVAQSSIAKRIVGVPKDLVVVSASRESSTAPSSPCCSWSSGSSAGELHAR